MALTPKQRKAILEKGLATNLVPADDTKYRSPNPKAAAQLFAKTTSDLKSPIELPADGRPEALPADRLLRQTVDRKHYRQTVSPDYRQTGSKIEPQKTAELPADGLTAVQPQNETKEIPLAPVQWAIWEALKEAEAAGRVVSYRKLAHAANASTRGVRDALAVIEKEGGIRSKTTVRTPDQQGMRIELHVLTRFRLASLKEAKGLLKRGGDYRQTVNRKSPALPADGLRLSVCMYIKQTDVAELLRILPVEWHVRERTLVEIACSFPSMTLLEFRRSLLLLVNQAGRSQTTIQNHNAWLRAAFAKSEGPLVTQRMIEVQLDQLSQTAKAASAKSISSKDDEGVQGDFDALRRYLSAGPEEKAVIEKEAGERAASALRVTPPEKHQKIQEQALIETARTFFVKKLQKN